MRNPVNHAQNVGSCFLFDGLADTVQTQRLDGGDVVLVGTVRALDERDFDFSHLKAPLLQYVFHGLAAKSGDLFR